MIIGLTGKKRSGKDTVYESLKWAAQYNGFQVRRLAFADPLKEEVAHACGVSVDHIEINKARYRPILQWWGTDFRRAEAGEDYWIRQMNTQLSRHNHPGELLVVTDMRFPNEMELVQEWEGAIVRVVRPPKGVLNRVKSLFSRDRHPSETALDSYPADFTLANTGTLDEFKEGVRRFYHGHVHSRLAKHH